MEIICERRMEEEQVGYKMNENTPERLRKILDALVSLHKELLQGVSLKVKNPSDIDQVKAVINDAGNQLMYVSKNRKLPPGVKMHPKVKSCMQIILNEIDPWDTDISTQLPYYIDRMYFQHPFSISPIHIERLYKNSIV